MRGEETRLEKMRNEMAKRERRGDEEEDKEEDKEENGQVGEERRRGTRKLKMKHDRVKRNEIR